MARISTLTVPINEWPEHADRVAEMARNGEIVLFPTETVYGIGTVPTSEGIDKLASLKGRSTGKPFQILISDIQTLDKWNAAVSPVAEKLIEAFWPGPMTLVLEVDSARMPRITAPSGSIGFRLPNHELCHDLVERSGGALAATSANLAGDAEPRTCFEAVRCFQGKIAAAVDAGPTSGSFPSTVVSVKGDIVTVLRDAAIPEKKILETANS